MNMHSFRIKNNTKGKFVLRGMCVYEEESGIYQMSIELETT